METAKVDIKKLQLLNDRISQCIDALAQVRLSVHGLSHSSGIGLESGATSGVQTTGIDPRFTGFAAQNPWATLPGQLGAQFGQAGIGQPMPFAPAGFATPFGGLSHSSLDVEAYNRPTWADPFLAARVAQTFPYARYAVPPVVSIY